MPERFQESDFLVNPPPLLLPVCVFAGADASQSGEGGRAQHEKSRTEVELNSGTGRAMQGRS